MLFTNIIARIVCKGDIIKLHIEYKEHFTNIHCNIWLSLLNQEIDLHFIYFNV